MASRKTDTTVTVPQRERRGRISVENYKILRRLGEGGMGEVFEAEQERPVRRRVALKVIKRGMDTDAVIARFESERQALALMEHPSIARIFDAGATEGGRPFFAMELVQGIPITDYCDEVRSTTQERIELFLQVCRGVHHAHQKGIIHRDLKPSNVLVTVRDGEPVPKIIDFGISKAMAQPAGGLTVYTEHGQLIGTPEYMSPEQAEPTAVDVDIRSDVYALGVLLYRLLTGVLPFEPDELRAAGFDEIRRKIREDEPARPSTRISRLEDDTSMRAARARRLDPRSFARLLRGDLDWIVMKALEKDRNRRYGSASDMAADLVRHLEFRPVEAGPPGVGYRMQKFVARHGVGVAVASLLVLIFILGAVGTTMGLLRAMRAEKQAMNDAETARQVSAFLVELFEVSNPSEGRGESITAREILDRGAEKISRELGDRPLTQARLMGVIGSVYQQLGLYDQAAPLLEEALRIHRELLDAEDPELARSLDQMAAIDRLLGNLPQAERGFRDALAIRERIFRADHPEIVDSLIYLANTLRQDGRYPEALSLCERALSLAERIFGTDHPRVAEALGALGIIYWRQGRFETAEEALVRALEIREKAPASKILEVAESRGDLGILYATMGRTEEAERLLRQVLETNERVLGNDHYDTGTAVTNLAAFYAQQGRLEEAEPFFLRALRIFEETVGTGSSQVWRGLHNLGALYRDLGRYRESETSLRRALELGKQSLGEDHPLIGKTQTSLANLFRLQERFVEAESFYRRAIDLRERTLSSDHPDLKSVVGQYSEMLRELGRGDEAAELEKRFPPAGGPVQDVQDRMPAG